LWNGEINLGIRSIMEINEGRMITPCGEGFGNSDFEVKL
jgi:hypothetical protein